MKTKHNKGEIHITKISHKYFPSNPVSPRCMIANIRIYANDTNYFPLQVVHFRSTVEQFYKADKSYFDLHTRYIADLENTGYLDWDSKGTNEHKETLKEWESQMDKCMKHYSRLFAEYIIKQIDGNRYVDDNDYREYVIAKIDELKDKSFNRKSTESRNQMDEEFTI